MMRRAELGSQHRAWRWAPQRRMGVLKEGLVFGAICGQLLQCRRLTRVARRLHEYLEFGPEPIDHVVRCIRYVESSLASIPWTPAVRRLVSGGIRFRAQLGASIRGVPRTISDAPGAPQFHASTGEAAVL